MPGCAAAAYFLPTSKTDGFSQVVSELPPPLLSPTGLLELERGLNLLKNLAAAPVEVAKNEAA